MRLLACVLAAGFALTLAACGGDERTAAPSAAPSAGASGAASEEPSASSAPSAQVPSEQAPNAEATDAARLTGDGIDLPGGVLVFGTPYDEAAPALARAFGDPTRDTGSIEPSGDFGRCPGSTLHVLEYDTLQVMFGDLGSGTPVLHTWALTDLGDRASTPRASALVGDAATYEFGVGTTVGELREGAGAAFASAEDELSLDPSFTVQDQSSGFRGFLSGTTPGDRVTFVYAGAGCA